MKPIECFLPYLTGFVAGDDYAGAVFGEADASSDHRYALWRVWDDDLPILVWCLLNPSTATHEKLDATIRRCIAWARLWGFGGILIVNAYAFRSTDPDVMLRSPDRVGRFNDAILARTFEFARTQTIPPSAPGTLMVAWGDGIETERRAQVAEIVADVFVLTHCLGRTRQGNPRHPVRLPYATPTEPWP